MSDRDAFGVNKNKLITRRIFVLSAAKVVVFAAIIGRLFSLQISENKKYSFLSDKNRLREWKLPPKRGIFEDYFGNTIADNNQVFQLHVVPEEVENFNYLIVRLKNIIKLENKEIKKIYKKKEKQLPWQTLIISENLSWEEFSKLNLFLHELQGAKPVFSVARKYPQAKNFTHVLGYVAEASEKDINNYLFIRENHVPGLRVGKTGLEKALEKELIGTSGLQRYEVNAHGKRISQIDRVEGTQGKSFRTTIDQEVQIYVQKLLTGKSGSISVMDIYTGDMIAMGSSPSFDPNQFVHGINKEKWDQINKDPLKPLINKSVSGLYSPGSSIKPLVALSALENNVIVPGFIHKCEGKMELYDHKYHCWKKKGHGHMSLRNAIKQSCDIYFFEIARRLGVDRLSVTAKKYGLGEKVLSNYFFEEKPGVIPSTQWKLKNIGRGWLLGETLLTGIGQGYIQCTPLELCLMTAQLANGGFKIQPRIIDDGTVIYEDIKSIIDNELNKYKSGIKIKNEIVTADVDLDLMKNESIALKPLFRNPENVEFVKEAMYAVSNEFMGTGYASRYEKKKYQYAGKTGTAQVKRITAEERELEIAIQDIPYKYRDHAIFVAFAPYKNPRYAISVLIEHGGAGGKVAAPLAKKVIKLVIDRHELREKIRKERKMET
jgi:penicillin-binding protein 2